jgi:hypothetical protein
MPYKSDKQRKFMHAVHPKIAAKWDKEIDDKKKKKLHKAEGKNYILG